MRLLDSPPATTRMSPSPGEVPAAAWLLLALTAIRQFRIGLKTKH